MWTVIEGSPRITKGNSLLSQKEPTSGPRGRRKPVHRPNLTFLSRRGDEKSQETSLSSWVSRRYYPRSAGAAPLLTSDTPFTGGARPSREGDSLPNTSGPDPRLEVVPRLEEDDTETVKVSNKRKRRDLFIRRILMLEILRGYFFGHRNYLHPPRRVILPYSPRTTKASTDTGVTAEAMRLRPSS